VIFFGIRFVLFKKSFCFCVAEKEGNFTAPRGLDGFKRELAPRDYYSCSSLGCSIPNADTGVLDGYCP